MSVAKINCLPWHILQATKYLLSAMSNIVGVFVVGVYFRGVQ